MQSVVGTRQGDASLMATGPGQIGLVSIVTTLITRSDGNIVSLDQYATDSEGGEFFLRVVFHREGAHGCTAGDRG